MLIKVQKNQQKVQIKSANKIVFLGVCLCLCLCRLLELAIQNTVQVWANQQTHIQGKIQQGMVKYSQRGKGSLQQLCFYQPP